tara:strand:+ start:73579 stop:75009 length:1431 start_codon:yes stop_codon:yes gene_type:complete
MDVLAQPGCLVSTSKGQRAVVQNDSFFKLLSLAPKCPQNIDEVNGLLAQFQNRKFLVANRGRNNPKQGSFSFFESFSSNARTGEAGIFLGHFTGLKNIAGKSVIDLDQSPDKGKLVIELIAWDEKKGYYNFYELIGQGTTNQWFYRGDSKDILQDNQAIYLSQPAQFGQRLRCSGCHVSGGPIMKEMAFPHNDWWIKSRPLVFENPQSEPFLKRLRVVDSAENFSTQVQMGIQKLEASTQYQSLKKSFSIPAQLRPLFCDLEINIQSDINPSDRAGNIQIPIASIGGPFTGMNSIAIPKAAYQGLMQKYGMQFPETHLQDADHAWLTPVKGYSDLLAVASLKASGLVDDKTILDVYFAAQIGVLMNKERCQLLKLVPNTGNWKPGFLQNLKLQTSAVAKSLYQRMTNPELNPQAYQKAIGEWYIQTSKKLQSGDVESAFVQLLKNRNAVFESDISKNPKGQILEPGFRVIFPVKRL